MVHALLVTMAFDTEASRALWFAKMEEILLYSNTKEANTLSYELYVPEEQTGEFPEGNVLERYVSKEDLTEEHLKSAVFEKLMAWIESDEMKPKVKKLELKHFKETDVSKSVSELIVKGGSGDGVLVFCGSRSGTVPAMEAEAKKLGAIIAEKKRTLVYGGGTVGLMGAIATEVHAKGGAITGIIPCALKPREVAGEMIGDVIYTPTMATRKSIMFGLSNTVISMPGGIGTFDELLEVMTLFQLNAYRPKIGILNVNGFYEPFFVLLKHMIAQGFLNEDAINYLVVAETASELWEKLETFTPPPSVKELTWTSRP